MRMKRAYSWVLALLAVAVVGCEVSDEFAPKQRTQIEKYLSGGSMEYRLTSDSVYVHLAGNKYDVSGDDRRMGAVEGDSITYYFEAYTFGTSPSNKPYYTNKRALAESISKDLNISYWDFEPREVVLGSGEILNGLEEAFEGSVAGDSLLVFLTSSVAYGNEGMGVVGANQAIMMILNVEEVAKKE